MSERSTTGRSANADRQRRYRDRKREGVPTEDQFARELCDVVFENVDNDAMRPVDAISMTRTRLLDRYSYAGINSVIVRRGERR